MKNIVKADRPKSAMAILPLRPFPGAGKAAQTAFKSAKGMARASLHGESLFPAIWES
jgi:hypothetical protein